MVFLILSALSVSQGTDLWYRPFRDSWMNSSTILILRWFVNDVQTCSTAAVAGRPLEKTHL